MKTFVFLITVFCTVIILNVSALKPEIISTTDGSLTFTVLSVSNGATYSPKNVFAVWIKDAQGNFVISRKVMAATRKVHLVKWMASSGNNSVGAITGATLPNHEFHTISWDCRDQSGVLVPDGTYEVWVEYTSRNSASGGDVGPSTFISFEKGASLVSLTIPDEAYFKNMTLQYIPSNVGLENHLPAILHWEAFPNPFSDRIHIRFEAPQKGFLNISVYDLFGKRVVELVDESIERADYSFSWDGRMADDCLAGSGIYVLRVVYNGKMFQQKIIFTGHQ